MRKKIIVLLCLMCIALVCAEAVVAVSHRAYLLARAEPVNALNPSLLRRGATGWITPWSISARTDGSLWLDYWGKPDRTRYGTANTWIKRLRDGSYVAVIVERPEIPPAFVTIEDMLLGTSGWTRQHAITMTGQPGQEVLLLSRTYKVYEEKNGGGRYNGVNMPIERLEDGTYVVSPNEGHVAYMKDGAPERVIVVGQWWIDDGGTRHEERWTLDDSWIFDVRMKGE